MNNLEIKNLYVSAFEKEILKDFNILIKKGEIHAIMGPNGTGKSTLSKVIMGDTDYKIDQGIIKYNKKEINNLSISERAKLGIFLGMQMPLEIAGVTNADFLRNALREKEGTKFNLYSFIKQLNKKSQDLKMDKEMINRGINFGFSGGERKKNEILQMHLLKPSLVILDEIDSGLDIDSLKLIGESVMEYYKEYKPAVLLITHYQRLLDYIKPNFVHIMKDGKIIKSGGVELVKEIEENGYDSYE